MRVIDAWQPPGGSYQDISLDSNYPSRFLLSSSLEETASAQYESIPGMSGFLRGILTTTREFPLVITKGDGITSATFHTNIATWFSTADTASAPGYLRVLAEDGVTLIRIPARVLSRSTITNLPDAYRVVLKADQPHFEEETETVLNSPTASIANDGNVRCGIEVELTGANLSSCSFGSASGDYTGRLLLIDVNVTPAATSRLLVNGVPTPWINAGSAHIWAIVSGESPTIEFIQGLTGNDPLFNTQITATQLVTTGTSAAYAYDDMRISTLINDSRLAGLWRPLVYLPQSFIQPENGWGYYAEDTADGFKLYLNDTPSFGGAGAWPYNAVYLDSGGPGITSVSSWDVVLAGFTGTEAKAVLLGRQRDSDVWEELWSSSTNGGTIVTRSPGSNYTEIMWTIVPLTDVLTTDPSLEINPDSSNTVTMGANPNLTVSSTRYKRLHGTFSNLTSGQSMTFTNFVTRDRVDFHTPSRRIDWAIELATLGLVYGYFSFSDPDRGMQLVPGTNSINNSAGASAYAVKSRGGYG